MPTQDSFAETILITHVVLYIVGAIVLGFYSRSKGYSMAVGIGILLLTSFFMSIIVAFVVSGVIVRLLPNKNLEAASTGSPLDDPKFRLRFEYEKARHEAEKRAAAQATQ